MKLDFIDPGEKNGTAGGHRICSPQQTIARIIQIKRTLGITRLANVTGLDRIGIPVALAIRPNSRSVAVSQGKGVTLEHAKASALMEATEIWHAERFDKPMYYSSARELADQHSLIDLEHLPQIATSAFTDSLRMLWAEAHDLMSGKDILAPFEMIHADYTRPVQPGHGCFPSSTNGLASGNHPLEAVCHGICEVIERDALALWDATRQSGGVVPRLALSSIRDETCQKLLQKFDEAEIDCTVWDITSDVGIASFVATIRESDGSAGHIGLGSGSHPDRVAALRRALTEAAQTRLNYITGSRDDLSMDEYTSTGLSEKRQSYDSLITDGCRPRHFKDVPTRKNGTLKADLDWLLQRLRAVGITQVAVVELTREELAIPVVRVIIPGLEAPHDDATYIPGPRARLVAETSE